MSHRPEAGIAPADGASLAGTLGDTQGGMPGGMPGVLVHFTGAQLDGLPDANLAHHRPHVPEHLAAARAQVGERTRTHPGAWHLMRQVHGADVAVVDEDVPVGAELRDVDVMVTTLPDRPLVVLTADCLPIVAAGPRAVGVAHAGWRGIVAGAPEALIAAMVGLGERAEDLRVVIGPAIGPCCYAVGPEVVEAVGGRVGSAVTTTRDGAPSVDLRLAAHTAMRRGGVLSTTDLEVGQGASGGPGLCTACGTGWFSHRRDPNAGRQAALVVRRGGAVDG